MPSGLYVPQMPTCNHWGSCSCCRHLSPVPSGWFWRHSAYPRARRTIRWITPWPATPGLWVWRLLYALLTFKEAWDIKRHPMPRKNCLQGVCSNCFAEVRILWLASSSKGNLSLQGDFQIQRWQMNHGPWYTDWNIWLWKKGEILYILT